MPTKALEAAGLPHPGRAPLGDVYAGVCTAPGHAGVVPPEVRLPECNLGYARCEWLPAERGCDAVRFVMGRERDGCYRVHYACELAHAPAAHGLLEFDRKHNAWRAPHPDACLQRMAECHLESHLRRVPHDAQQQRFVGTPRRARHDAQARRAGETPRQDI